MGFPHLALHAVELRPSPDARHGDHIAADGRAVEGPALLTPKPLQLNKTSRHMYSFM